VTADSSPSQSPQSYPGFPHVRGKCPSCSWKSLFLGAGGFVTCANLDCPDPTRASLILRAFDGYSVKVETGVV
jgi:hypothetical protein